MEFLKNKMIGIIFILPLFLYAGCGGSGATIAPTPQGGDPALLKGTWELQSVDGVDVSSAEMVYFYSTYEDRYILGNSTCRNQGQYGTTGIMLNLTLNVYNYNSECGTLGETEAIEYTVTDTDLYLSQTVGGATETKLYTKAVTGGGTVEGSWALETINDASVSASQVITATFNGDGTFSGTGSGCSAEYFDDVVYQFCAPDDGTWPTNETEWTESGGDLMMVYTGSEIGTMDVIVMGNTEYIQFLVSSTELTIYNAYKAHKLGFTKN